jgi:hypothetical protein
MNKKETVSFLKDVVYQLFDHGWAEDYKDMLEWNDQEKIKHLFELALEGDKKALNNYINREQWDEEVDVKYDDGGLFSFAQEVAKLLRQYKAIDEEKKAPQQVKINVVTNYSYKCPHCGGRNHVSEYQEKETNCDHCQNPVILEYWEKK